LKYTIIPTKPLNVQTNINAAFAMHDSSKSHPGVAIFITGVLVNAASKKQGFVTESPTESELVPLTDNIGLVELFKGLLHF
jgi:hypothetical protein